MSAFPLCNPNPRLFVIGDGHYSESNQRHRETVPEGKMWQVIRVVMNRGDSATGAIQGLRPNKTDVCLTLNSASAATGTCIGPVVTSTRHFQPCMLDEGEILDVLFGAAQTTGGDYVNILLLEFDKGEIRAKYQEAVKKYSK